MSLSLSAALKEKIEPFWPKKLVKSLSELKFDPGFRVIGEYMSQIDSILRVNFEIESSQFDSNILQLLGILGRILVPTVTQLFRLKWLHFFFSEIKFLPLSRSAFKLTRYWESILKLTRVNLTQIFSNYSESWVEF